MKIEPVGVGNIDIIPENDAEAWWMDCVHDGTCACFGVAYWAIESGANPCYQKQQEVIIRNIILQLEQIKEQVNRLESDIKDLLAKPVANSNALQCETKGGLVINC